MKHFIAMLGLTLLVGFSVAGNTSPTTQTTRPATQAALADFTRVQIESHPPFGSASKTVTPDGSVEGSHMSGTPQTGIRVFESKNQVSAEDMTQLLKWVAAVKAKKPATQPSATGQYKLLVIWNDGEREFSADTDMKFGSAETQAIWDLVSKQSAGGW